MSKKPEQPLPVPSTGGSYVRDKDGTLIEDKPAKATEPNQPKDAENGS